MIICDTSQTDTSQIDVFDELSTRPSDPYLNQTTMAQEKDVSL